MRFTVGRVIVRSQLGSPRLVEIARKHALPIIKLVDLTLEASWLVKNEALKLLSVALEVEIVRGLHVIPGSSNNYVQRVHLARGSWGSQ